MVTALRDAGMYLWHRARHKCVADASRRRTAASSARSLSRDRRAVAYLGGVAAVRDRRGFQRFLYSSASQTPTEHPNARLPQGSTPRGAHQKEREWAAI